MYISTNIYTYINIYIYVYGYIDTYIYIYINIYYLHIYSGKVSLNIMGYIHYSSVHKTVYVIESNLIDLIVNKKLK